MQSIAISKTILPLIICMLMLNGCSRKNDLAPEPEPEDNTSNILSNYPEFIDDISLCYEKYDDVQVNYDKQFYNISPKNNLPGSFPIHFRIDKEGKPEEISFDIMINKDFKQCIIGAVSGKKLPKTKKAVLDSNRKGYLTYFITNPYLSMSITDNNKQIVSCHIKSSTFKWKIDAVGNTHDVKNLESTDQDGSPSLCLGHYISSWKYHRNQNEPLGNKDITLIHRFNAKDFLPRPYRNQTKELNHISQECFEKCLSNTGKDNDTSSCNLFDENVYYSSSYTGSPLVIIDDSSFEINATECIKGKIPQTQIIRGEKYSIQLKNPFSIYTMNLSDIQMCFELDNDTSQLKHYSWKINEDGKAYEILPTQNNLVTNKIDQCIIDLIGKTQYPKPINPPLNISEAFTNPYLYGFTTDQQKTNIEQCFLLGKYDKPEQVKLSWTLDREGNAHNINVLESNTDSKQVEECLLFLVDSLSFPYPVSPLDVTLQYTFQNSITKSMSTLSASEKSNRFFKEWYLTSASENVDKTQITKIIQNHIDDFTQCYEQAIRTNQITKRLKKNVDFTWIIHPHQQISIVNLANHLVTERFYGSQYHHEHFKNENLENCLTKVINSWPYPKVIDDDTATIELSFYTSPKEELAHLTDDKKDNDEPVQTKKKQSITIESNVKIKDLNIRGKLNKNAVQKVVTQNLNTLKSCYDRVLEIGKLKEGDITVMWIINPGNGRVIKTDVYPQTNFSKNTTDCITNAIQLWEFPKYDDDVVTVVKYTFGFGYGIVTESGIISK